MAEPMNDSYPARLAIDFPDEGLDRVSTLLRIFYIIPIFIVLALISGGSWTFTSGQEVTTFTAAGGILFFPVLLMILFRKKYPHWWFAFNLELVRFSTRVGAYLFLMSDRYPSTDEEQYVHLDLDYPDVDRDLNRGLPLVKWLLAIPHYIVLFFLYIAGIFAVIGAWFAILFTGRYPQGIFDYLVGVFRWSIRVHAYAMLLITDRYPPFSLR